MVEGFSVSDRKDISVAVVGLGWMGQAHSRSLIRIPTLFSNRNFNPILKVCADFDSNRGKQAIEDFGFERATKLQCIFAVTFLIFYNVLSAGTRSVK